MCGLSGEDGRPSMVGDVNQRSADADMARLAVQHHHNLKKRVIDGNLASCSIVKERGQYIESRDLRLNA